MRSFLSSSSPSPPPLHGASRLALPDRTRERRIAARRKKKEKKRKKKKGNAVGEEQRHFSVRLRFRSVVNAAIFCFRLAIRSEICPLERMEHCHYRVRIFSFLSADFVIRPIETLTDSRALPRTTRGYDLCWILNVPIHRESYQRYYD
jgi:hypothetical protein